MSTRRAARALALSAGLAGLVAIGSSAACASSADGAASDSSAGAGGASGSGGSGGGTVTTDSDAGALFDAGSATDAAAPSKFFLLVAQTPAGSPPPSEWGGILRYSFADDGAPAVMGTAIDKSLVHDPLGLAFRKTSAEVFVGNRHGNAAADGVPGSVSRFLYDAATESFTPSPKGDITGNGMGAISQVAFDPDEGELFAANCCNGGNGITRFKIDANGDVVANGAIATDQMMQGLAVAPDGKRLYATGGGGPATAIYLFDLPSGAPAGSFTVPGASRLHHITRAGSDLYIGDVDGPVFRVRIGQGDELSFVEAIPADHPLSVVMSPDELELFATAHDFGATSIIDRYQANGAAWTPTTTIVTPASNGGTLAFSAAAVPVPK